MTGRPCGTRGPSSGPSRRLSASASLWPTPSRLTRSRSRQRISITTEPQRHSPSGSSRSIAAGAARIRSSTSERLPDLRKAREGPTSISLPGSSFGKAGSRTEPGLDEATFATWPIQALCGSSALSRSPMPAANTSRCSDRPITSAMSRCPRASGPTSHLRYQPSLKHSRNFCPAFNWPKTAL